MSLLSWGRPQASPAEALVSPAEAQVAPVTVAPSAATALHAIEEEASKAAASRGLAAAALRMSGEPATLVIAVPDEDTPEDAPAATLAVEGPAPAEEVAAPLAAGLAGVIETATEIPPAPESHGAVEPVVSEAWTPPEPSTAEAVAASEPEPAPIIEVAVSGPAEVADQGETAALAEPTRSELSDPIRDLAAVEAEPNAGDAVPDSASIDEPIAAATETGIEESAMGSTTAHGVEEPAPEETAAVAPPVPPAPTLTVAEAAVPAEAPLASMTSQVPVTPALHIESPDRPTPAPAVTPKAPPQLGLLQRILRAILNFFRAIFGL